MALAPSNHLPSRTINDDDHIILSASSKESIVS
jgi:hypothetical protein